MLVTEDLALALHEALQRGRVFFGEVGGDERLAGQFGVAEPSGFAQPAGRGRFLAGTVTQLAGGAQPARKSLVFTLAEQEFRLLDAGEQVVARSMFSAAFPARTASRPSEASSLSSSALTRFTFSRSCLSDSSSRRRSVDRDLVAITISLGSFDISHQPWPGVPLCAGAWLGPTHRCSPTVAGHRAVASGELRRSRRFPKGGHPLLFPADKGAYLNLHNSSADHWTPAVRAAGLAHRPPYALLHTFAAFSIAAGLSLFELARFMGTSIDQIDKTYGHLLPDSLDRTRSALDVFIHNTAEAAGVSAP